MDKEEFNTWLFNTSWDELVEKLPSLIEFVGDGDETIRHFLDGTLNGLHMYTFLHEIKRESERRKKYSNWKESDARAKELLINSITPEQREQYKSSQEIIVYGSKSNQIYLIHKRQVQNITVLSPTAEEDFNTNKKTYAYFYCLHAKDDLLPDEDTMLSQILLIENDEEEFLRLANKVKIDIEMKEEIKVSI